MLTFDNEATKEVNIIAFMNGEKSVWLRAAASHHITKTCLYNVETLKHYFYIVKLGFTGVNIIFLISA